MARRKASPAARFGILTMLSRISVVFRLLTITAVSLLALAGVGIIGVISTGAVQEMVFGRG